MGSFTLLIFGTNGGMGEECKMFMNHLAKKLTEKDVEGYLTLAYEEILFIKIYIYNPNFVCNCILL